MSNKPLAVFLFNVTPNAPEAFATLGYECHCYDLAISEDYQARIGSGEVHYHHQDLKTWVPPKWMIERGVNFMAAFPPCTDIAVSGARWFRKKGLRGLSEAIDLFGVAVDWLEYFDCPGFIENPVSVISSHYRKPDHTFQPWQFSGHCANDNYTKKTCLWVSDGFVMPDPFFDPSIEIDDRIHKAPPSEGRAAFRSATPRGFMTAVAASNGVGRAKKPRK